MPTSICFGIITIFFVLLFLMRFRDGEEWLFPALNALLIGVAAVASVGSYAEGAFSVFFYAVSAIFAIGCLIVLVILVTD